MAAMPGAAPQNFLFTVCDEAVVAQLSAAVDNRVALRYAQHKGLLTSCMSGPDTSWGACARLSEQLASARNQLTFFSRPCQYGSRNLNFCSLPVAVRARLLRNSTLLGHL